MPDLQTRTDHEQETALLILLYLQEAEANLRNGGTVDWLNWTVHLGGELAGLLAATYEEAAGQIVGEHGGWLSDSGRPMQWASQRASWVAASMATTTRDAVAAAQQRWARGVGDNFMADLESYFSQSRAETVAVTETTNAISEGEHYGAAELAAIAIVLIPIWATEEDDKVCPICAPLNRDKQNVWQGEFPTGPPGHPNCLLPWNEVVAPGRVVAATKAKYVGPCVEATFANGAVISVTENHPVLTSCGWIPAKLLAKGGDAYCALDSQWMANSINPNGDNRPTPIEQVFRSIKESGGMATASVPSSAKQFHGDGVFFDGNVEVVYPDSFLSSAFNLSLAKPLNESSLGLTLSFADSFRSGRAANLFVDAARASTAGVVSRRKHGASLCIGCGRPTPEHGIRDSARGNSGNEDLAAKGLSGDADLASKFLLRFSSDVSLQNVIKVRNFDWGGHVYDLQVEPYSLYTCNGIVVHNCRCRMEWLRV